ncbi:sensor histidine kinase [Shivajiella indica]|uniref:Sensor histidine kinase n=1 Tax=Shivajiella indica TaxID=872115 RepID=A0ABW5B5V8_9BACT
MDRLNDKWLRLIGVPLTGMLSNLVFFDAQNEAAEISRITAMALSVGESLLLWETNRLGILLSRRKFPTIKATTARISTQVIWFMVMTVTTRFLLSYYYDSTQFWGYALSSRAYVFNIVVPFFFIIPIASIYEAMYFYRQWYRSHFEGEKLKKEHLQSQLLSLKSQLNPHFLFNSLSTLSSLIPENPVLAEKFTDELADTYRYVLKTQDQVLSPLKEELNFIKTYFNLLETRFGKGIRLEIQVYPQYENHYIPSLTLQLLVENAVKHNAVSDKTPLVIKIFTDEMGNLFVKNNLNKKLNMVASPQMGLRNIISKYKLLNQPEVIINHSEESFQVQLALISSQEMTKMKLSDVI